MANVKKEKKLLSIRPDKTVEEKVVQPTEQEELPEVPTEEIQQPQEEVNIPEVEMEIVTEKEITSELQEYWEIVYMNGKQEVTLYTKIQPTLLATELVVDNAFSKLELKEVVLNKKVVSYSCLKKLDDSPEIKIPLNKGLLIKVLSEQPWMLRDEFSTTMIFNTAVLDAYRELTAQLSIPATPIQQTQQSVQQNQPSIDVSQNQNAVPLTVPGNINTNQPGRPKLQ